jgi:hypothetical protein
MEKPPYACYGYYSTEFALSEWTISLNVEKIWTILLFCLEKGQKGRYNGGEETNFLAKGDLHGDLRRQI